MTPFACCDERRRSAVSGRAGHNGIDYLEVVDGSGNSLGPPLTTLVLHFINPPTGLAFGPNNVVITGGERFKAIKVVAANFHDPIPDVLDDRALVVSVDRAGDFSVYQLMLIDGTAAAGAPAGIDPILRAVDFTFRPGCDAGFDVIQPPPHRPVSYPKPPIDYLARDWTSLRQVLMDRLAVLSPGAVSDDPVDLAVTLVEVFAYVGDVLSYRQDAVATEATLDTCRQRISARRHARLVDYVMHNGCNARVWVTAEVEAALAVPAGTRLFTTSEGVPTVATDAQLADALALGGEAFETVGDATVRPELNRLSFHTWGDRRCCLPKGATSATLVAGALHAADMAGAVLILMELKGPETGVPADADPARRWPVKVLSARDASDPLGHAFDTPPSDDPLAVIEIGWGIDDALPFSLCVSAEITTADGLVVVGDVSAAVGNVLLADHGLTEDRAGPIGTVPFPALAALAQPRPGGSLVDDPATDACAPRPRLTIPPRFQPSLQAMNLTHAALVDDTSATSCLRSTPADARATVTDVESLDEDGTRVTWSARFPDLLASGLEPVYVVEVDNALIGSLRFGDDTYGRRPTPGAQFTARARSGNGSSGNVGAGTITHVVLPVPDIVKPVLTNPLPATGGVDPQSIESVRREAPFAFRQQRRAVTREDYADQAGAFPGVQRASVNLRWTGSWHTHFVAIDRLGGGDPDQAFTDALGRSLEAVRLAGHDLQIERPRNVAIEITLRVYLGDNQLRGAVLQALQRALGSGDDGLFGPDRFTFGQPVYLSPVVAAAQAVPGVKAVQVVRFQRRDAPGGDGIAQGRLDVGRNEVARLDNDPNYPDRGVLSLILVGGR